MDKKTYLVDESVISGLKQIADRLLSVVAGREIGPDEADSIGTYLLEITEAIKAGDAEKLAKED